MKYKVKGFMFRAKGKRKADQPCVKEPKPV